jgi:hypothetical protein
MTGTGEGNGNIDVGAIARAPVEMPPVEAVPRNVDPLTGQDGKLNQHLGKVGQFIGGGPEKAGNIAYIVIVAAFLVLVLATAATYGADGTKLAPILDKLVTGCISLITGAMGYLFGASKGND